MIERARYIRQMLLAEVGERGQARLESAVARVGGNGLCHEIATSYLARAGVGRIVGGPIHESELAPPFLRHSATRAVVAGSRAAVAAFRVAIGSEAEPGPAHDTR